MKYESIFNFKACLKFLNPHYNRIRQDTARKQTSCSCCHKLHINNKTSERSFRKIYSSLKSLNLVPIRNNRTFSYYIKFIDFMLYFQHCMESCFLVKKRHRTAISGCGNPQVRSSPTFTVRIYVST